MHSTTTLALFATLNEASFQALDGEWRIAAAHGGDGFELGYADSTFDDSLWETVHLPHLRHSTVEQDSLWYRHHFAVNSPSAGKRIILHFGGAFYHTFVWLNGVPLGRHEGYFQSFGFDITDLVKPGDNLLAVRCSFPVEAGSFKRKTAIAGIFADWDCKPYPSALYPQLPSPHTWTVPLGLWQPVHLRLSGPVLVESFNIFPRVMQPAWSAPVARAEAAELLIRIGLRNLSTTPQHARINLIIEPHNFSEHVTVQNDSPWTVELNGEECRQFEYTLVLPQPRLWFPWTHGQPYLYRARLMLDFLWSPAADQAVQVFGVRQVQAVIEPDRWEWWLNGRRIFPKGSNYISDFYLDRVTVEGLSHDLQLARGANLDLLRVHAHIAPPDFYRLCGEQGLMVMCDLPLIWTHAFNLAPAEAAAFKASVLKQAAEMVELFGSHPGIILWSMHNEPPWTPDGSFLGSDLHQAAVNQELDYAAAERVQALDPTRPVIPASGEFDQHLYHGWYAGSWYDNRNWQPTFPTEFGVQALPSLASPLWATVNTHWPVDADDPSWAHAGYQSLFWTSPGVGLPAQYTSLADYVAESQAYQAFYIRYVIDQWRRQKFAPVGGYIHFLFTDGWPAITWSVLDYARLPKLGYEALAEASRPVRLALDLEEGFNIEGVFHLVYPERSCLKVGLYLVNDDYRQEGRVSIHWWLERRDEGKLWQTARRWFRTHTVSVVLPRADEGAQRVQSIEIPLRRPGEYTFCTEVRQKQRVLDKNRLDFRVGEVRQQRRLQRRIPRLLVNKVYQVGSLRHTGDGFTFNLRNPAMPILIERLRALRVDNVPIDPVQIELVSGGVSRQVSTITPHAPLEISSREQLTVVVWRHSLKPGRHRLEITAELFGLGEISAQVQDSLV